MNVNGYTIEPIADLQGAYLRDADLRGAYLQVADLRDADLRGAHLQGADLRDADLRDANLQGAHLQDADLRGAHLQYADLRDANLQGAHLQDAHLQGAMGIPATARAVLSILPDGDIIGWKKCQRNVIVKLRVPADAARSNAAGRKCRASYADVLEVIGADEAYSRHDNSFIYRPGETVRPESFNDDWTVECGGGIHFFITLEEADQS
jgi:uncharacterized protein YjbI with pentapeptide repeats